MSTGMWFIFHMVTYVEHLVRCRSRCRYRSLPGRCITSVRGTSATECVTSSIFPTAICFGLHDASGADAFRCTHVKSNIPATLLQLLSCLFACRIVSVNFNAPKLKISGRCQKLFSFHRTGCSRTDMIPAEVHRITASRSLLHRKEEQPAVTCARPDTTAL